MIKLIFNRYQFYLAILSRSYSRLSLESMSPEGSACRSLLMAAAVALGLRTIGLFSLFRVTFAGCRDMWAGGLV